MARYAIVQGTEVLNTIEWDGSTPWSPPEGTQAILLRDTDITDPGGTYIDGVFAPKQTEAPPGL